MKQGLNIGDLLGVALSAALSDDNSGVEQKTPPLNAAVLGGIPGDYDIELKRVGAIRDSSQLRSPEGKGWFLVSLHNDNDVFFALWARPPRE